MSPFSALHLMYCLLPGNPILTFAAERTPPPARRASYKVASSAQLLGRPQGTGHGFGPSAAFHRCAPFTASTLHPDTCERGGEPLHRPCLGRFTWLRVSEKVSPCGKGLTPCNTQPRWGGGGLAPQKLSG